MLPSAKILLMTGFLKTSLLKILYFLQSSKICLTVTCTWQVSHMGGGIWGEHIRCPCVILVCPILSLARTTSSLLVFCNDDSQGFVVSLIWRSLFVRGVFFHSISHLFLIFSLIFTNQSSIGNVFVLFLRSIASFAA